LREAPTPVDRCHQTGKKYSPVAVYDIHCEIVAVFREALFHHRALFRRESMRVKDFLGCVGWTALVLLAAVSVPIAGPFISLLTPVPFLYYGTKWGLSGGLTLAAVTVFVISLAARFFGQPQLILFVIVAIFLLIFAIVIVIAITTKVHARIVQGQCKVLYATCSEKGIGEG